MRITVFCWALYGTWLKRVGRGAVWDLKINKTREKKNNSLIPPSFQTKLLIEIKNATRQKKSVENSQIFIFSEENCSRFRKTLERSSLIIFHRKDTKYKFDKK